MSPIPLFDTPIARGYEVLTHRNAGRKYAQNGYGQVGNTTVPANPITKNSVTTSAIYNKGLSEAGYGRRYPYPRGLSHSGLSAYRGAGSYGTSGSRPGLSRSGLAYSGAGSYGASGSQPYRPGLAYSGAGSYGAAGSKLPMLRDAYINDNPPPGSLRGLSDDPAPSDTGTAYGPSIPGAAPTDTSGGFFSSISNAFSNILGTAVSTAASVGQAAASNAVANAIAPPPKPNPVQQAITTVKAALPKTILGVTMDTALLVGAGIGAYYLIKKK